VDGVSWLLSFPVNGWLVKLRSEFWLCEWPSAMMTLLDGILYEDGV
jgi:hypothetical protein